MLCYHYQYVTVLPQCDAIVSKKIRERDGWRCQRCRNALLLALQTYIAYTFGRSNDFDNCDAIFSFCHFEWEADKQGD
jgi:hypothetical protein